MANGGSARPADAEEGQRRTQLVSARRRATLLLGSVTVLFIVMTALGYQTGWPGYLQAAAEASMVGGVADWFAVTALFRRPLGLPIPHTAVIVERKDQFGETLGRFVQENFLNAPVLAERLRAAEVPRRLAMWLAQPEHAALAAARAADLVVEVADLFRDEDVHEILTRELTRAVEALPVARLAGRLLRAATADGRHTAVFDSLVGALDHLLEENRDALRARFRDESPRWVPELIDDAVFERILRRLHRQLHEMATDPNHRYRAEMEVWLAHLAERLESSSELAERAERLKIELISRVELREWSSAVWAEFKNFLRHQATEPDSELRRRLADALSAGGRRLGDDEALRRTVEQAAESLMSSLAEHFQADLAGLVSTTIGRWDPKDTADRLELLLGRDLQYIRINGTVVGALVGLTLHGLAQAIG